MSSFKICSYFELLYVPSINNEMNINVIIFTLHTYEYFFIRKTI